MDRFKQLNETHGHTTGDELLKLFAERLRGSVRETDTVAHLGGDKFVVLVTALQDVAHSAILAQKILRSLADPFEILGVDIRITVSIGIALYHPELTAPGDYLDRSDAALSVAKQEGRNTYRFHTETLDDLFRTEVDIGTDLHHALDDEELTIQYQPQIDLRTNRVVGLEALARWSHHRRGRDVVGIYRGGRAHELDCAAGHLGAAAGVPAGSGLVGSRFVAGCYGDQFVAASV